jgi:hypothetical protein
VNELAEQTPSTTTVGLWNREEFASVMRDLAMEEAPRRFALVEEYGEAEDARVAGYGLAYTDRAEVNTVEGGFHLNSQSVESARTLFQISSRSTGVRRVHVVWLDNAATPTRQD